MDIGKRIKLLRTNLGMSQNELADKMGYTSRTTISKIESGNIKVTTEDVVKFADELFSTVPYLMGWSDSENQSNKDTTKILQDSNNDTPEKDSYYLDDDAREMAQFMFDNPEYKVLFDATRKVKKEDIEFVKDFIERLNK